MVVLFSSVDPGYIIYGLLFVIFFVIIRLLLLKSLKDNSSSSVIAFCVSLLSVYGLNTMRIDFSDLMFNLNLNDTLIYTVIPIIIIAGIIYIFWKVKFRVIMLILGFMLIVASRFVYKKTAVLVAGIIFILIGIVLLIQESRRSVKKRIYLK